MLVKSYAGFVSGISAVTVTVEVNISPGVRFFLVGLPDNAVKESQQRIESALRAVSFRWPGKQVVVNMAPADIRKEGSSYDLSLAIGILAANENIPSRRLGSFLLMGELSLDGTLKPVKGILPVALRAKADGFEGIVVPVENAPEAAVVKGLQVYGMHSLSDVISFFNETEIHSVTEVDMEGLFSVAKNKYDLDFADVKGQASVKRAFEVAAAGGHNLIMIGSPGSGKTMLARRMPTIAPPLTLDEALETTKIHSVAGKLAGNRSLITQRPFRSPHHTISNIALVGGGSNPLPGEISLAHNGILFLDELPEFNRNVLEVLRQPLEERTITISRARTTVDYPTGFVLIGAMNPCPCGYYNHPDRECVCSPGAVQKYLNKISGPLLDRIDIHIEVVPVPFNELASADKPESSSLIRERVVRAREMQQERFRNLKGIYCNARMNGSLVKKFVVPDRAGNMLLRNGMDLLGLSARAYDRILKVSRTIADLELCENVLPEHISEAIGYRNLDREGWAG